MSKPVFDPRDLPTLLNKPELRELYRTLGKTEEERDARVTQILLDFYRRMSSDAMLGFFFQGRDVASIAMKQKQFLLRAFGASPSYSGKPPADAHTALPPILEGQFNRRLVLLAETLRAHGLSEAQTETWVSFENAFRAGIVAEG
jgi:truncated hemoglobin YjbI